MLLKTVSLFDAISSATLAPQTKANRFRSAVVAFVLDHGQRNRCLHVALQRYNWIWCIANRTCRAPFRVPICRPFRSSRLRVSAYIHTINRVFLPIKSDPSTGREPSAVPSDVQLVHACLACQASVFPTSTPSPRSPASLVRQQQATVLPLCCCRRGDASAQSRRAGQCCHISGSRRYPATQPSGSAANAATAPCCPKRRSS